jgi:tetratricopeptide (TPR) repeat protein
MDGLTLKSPILAEISCMYRLLLILSNAFLYTLPLQAQNVAGSLDSLKMDTIQAGDDYFFVLPFDIVDRNSANRFYTEASYHFQKGNLVLASTYMKKAIKKQPNRPEYHILQSYILTELGDKQAIKHAEKAVELRPQDWKAYYCLALSRFTFGDFLGASIEYSKALEIDASVYQLYEGRGHAKARMNDQLGALQDFNLAIMLKPAYIKAYYGRGMAYYKLGKYTEAVADFTSILLREADNANAYYYRGMSRKMLGDVQNSCRDFDKAAKLGNPLAKEEMEKNCYR